MLAPALPFESRMSGDRSRRTVLIRSSLAVERESSPETAKRAYYRAPNWHNPYPPFSLCVTGEDKVTRFDLIVAGKAGFHEGLVARFAVLEVSETPTARRGVLFCILDHKLNVRWGAGY